MIPARLLPGLLALVGACRDARDHGPTATDDAAAAARVDPSSTTASESGATVTTAPGPGAGDGLTVLAAASLTDVLPKVGAAFSAHGGVPVTFSFDATSRLAKQVEAGIPADLFFSADRQWMETLAGRELLAGAAIDLLGNSLVLAVSATVATPPASADDLDAQVARLALAGENVPAGKYARAALRSLGAWDALAGRVVEGDTVRTALGWVARGEADAAVVYATDVRVEPSVKVAFTFPADSHPEIVYPAAVLRGARDATAAGAFLTFCRGGEARAIWQEAGFAVPQ